MAFTAAATLSGGIVAAAVRRVGFSLASVAFSVGAVAVALTMTIFAAMAAVAVALTMAAFAAVGAVAVALTMAAFAAVTAVAMAFTPTAATSTAASAATAATPTATTPTATTVTTITVAAVTVTAVSITVGEGVGRNEFGDNMVVPERKSHHGENHETDHHGHDDLPGWKPDAAYGIAVSQGAKRMAIHKLVSIKR
jgi:hypothetical protein